jgi:hypothetical protein
VDIDDIALSGSSSSFQNGSLTIAFIRPVRLGNIEDIMQIDEFTNKFLHMEMQEQFFQARTPNGDPLWDVVRYYVFISLYDEIIEPAHSRPSFSHQSRQSWLNSLFTVRLKVLSTATQLTRLVRLKPTDFVAYVYSRNKDANNQPIDSASADAFQELMKMGSILKVESEQKLLQDVNIAPLYRAFARVVPWPAGVKDYIHKFTQAIANAQGHYFGVIDPNLSKLALTTYRYYLIQRQVWRRILDRSQPRLILMTQNGIQKGLIVEARKRHIPVVECQHGVINLMHPCYTYPPELLSGDAVLLPDALLLFSDYWKDQCRMPGTKMAVVGNNRFSSAGVQSTRTGAAVLLDAASFHKHLSPLAIELARLMPEQRFIIKLHPTDVLDREKIEKEYQGIPNISVVGAEKSCAELFADASDVVVIQSTASYEALDRGVPVHFFRRAGYISHQDLFAQSGVHLFSSTEELSCALFKPRASSERIPRYFDDFDSMAFRALVQVLCSEA